MKKWNAWYLCLLLLPACIEITPDEGAMTMQTARVDNSWDKYWYAGDAEVNVFEVEQARYAEVHPGTAVLVFVTEDFLTEKQVKNENYLDANSTSVLKTNLMQTFTTGLYDYSIMSSIFTPIDRNKFPTSLKVTTSSQDWCGHSYMQLNHQKNKFKVSQYSYFENEGDKIFEVPLVQSEDELFNLIRIDPSSLPIGETVLLPSTVLTRLKHIKYKPYSVQLSNKKYSGNEFPGDNLQIYEIVFPELDRTKQIIYASDFPHEIVGWTDEYPVVMSGNKLRTIARKKHVKKLPYWSMHDLVHSALRAELGLK